MLSVTRYMTSDTFQRPGRSCAPAPPSPPRGHITHLLEQTLHKVAISAGSRKRQVSDKLGSAADGQAGRWGGQAAPRREPRSPASSQGRRGSASRQVRALSQAPLPSAWKPLLPAAAASRGALSPVLWSELHQGRWSGHSEGWSSRERRYVCWLRVAKSGCMSVPVSQLPGQGAISGADASPALGGLSKYSTAAGSPDEIPPDGHVQPTGPAWCRAEMLCRRLWRVAWPRLWRPARLKFTPASSPAPRWGWGWAWGNDRTS